MPTEANGRPDAARRLDAVIEVLRPSPMEFAGFLTGGTIGAYAGGGIGAVAGMFIGATLFYLAEKAIDRTAGHDTPPRP